MCYYFTIFLLCIFLLFTFYKLSKLFEILTSKKPLQSPKTPFPQTTSINSLLYTYSKTSSPLLTLPNLKIPNSTPSRNFSKVYNHGNLRSTTITSNRRIPSTRRPLQVCSAIVVRRQFQRTETRNNHPVVRGWDRENAARRRCTSTTYRPRVGRYSGSSSRKKLSDEWSRS